VLDFGCGPGFIWDHLNKNENARWQYTALEFSHDSVLTVLEKAKGHKNFKEVKHVHSLPSDLPDDHFDVILLIEVVEHLNDAYLDGTLCEVARLLKKEGVVVISTPNNEDLFQSKNYCPECGAVFHKWQHVRSWSVDSLSERLKQQGFKLRMVKTLDFAAQAFNAQGILNKIKRIVWRLLKGDPSNPHMIAVFRK
jgi:SAM-dependent methyltransferase